MRANKAVRLRRNQAISDGLRKLPSNTMIPIHGKLVAANDAASVFEAATAAENEVALARAKYAQAVATARAAESTIKTLISPIKGFVQNSFGEHSHTSVSFGFEPRKAGYVSAEARYKAVEKLRATRAARGIVDA